MRRRLVFSLIAGSALIAAGCSDATAPVPAAPNTELLTFGYGSELAAAKKSGAKTSVVHFVMTPHGGHVKIGNFTLDYPAGAVCDPSTTAYGPGEWKKRCKALNASIIITARYSVIDGRSFVEFGPDIRFAPDKVVTLSAMVRELRNQVLTDALKNEFALRSSGTEDDVIATTFEVRRNGKATGVISRRVEHFSGYYVRSGCEDESSPECQGEAP